MTSTGDRRRDDDTGRSLVVGARFFKIILQSTIRDRKLLIPDKFVGNHRGEWWPESAILKVPSGATWAVDVVRDEIGVWFSNGWREFAEFHSLEFGHFLVFEYEGCSRFSVVICDKSAAEIDYPIPTIYEANAEGNEGSCIIKTSKSLIEVSQHQVKNRKTMMRGSIFAGIPESKRGNASTSSISPSFFITMSQYYMESGYANVPIDFVIKHMKLEKSDVMVYGEEDGSGPWLLSFVFRPGSKARGGRGRGFFCGGWSAFCNDNSLKLGDVCRFKLVSSNEMEMTVQRN